MGDSPLGFIANVGDFSRDMTFTGQKENKIDKTYTQDRIKQSQIHYQANELTCTFTNKEKKNINIIFRVSNNDNAFRYEMPKYGDTGSRVIEKETTCFDVPSFTTTFLCPQSDATVSYTHLCVRNYPDGRNADFARTARRPSRSHCRKYSNP